jgi:aspartate/methionine/tyrosine aminotransferase
MFLWGKVSGKADGDKSLGEALADKVLYEAGVFITPGFIFGKNGGNYVRISLCAKPELLKKAAERIKKIW